MGLGLVLVLVMVGVAEAPGGLEVDILSMQFRVGLAQHVVPRLGVVEHLLQVLDPLVFPLAIGSL